MKKISYLFGLFIFTLFIPKVYAFTYELETSVSNINVKKGTETEIKVSLKNIKDTGDGIASCTLNIEFDNNVVLNSQVGPLGSWTLTSGKVYLFDTGEPVTASGDLLVIPVKVNGNGSVKLSNIECSDGVTLAKTSDRSVNFTIINDTTNNNSGNSSNNVNVDNNYNFNLADIKLSDGTIEFDPNVTDYYIEVDNYDDLIIEPVLVDNRLTFYIEKMDDKEVNIIVSAPDGTYKKYSIFVDEISTVDTDIEKEKNNNNNYVFIFIAIICVLVFINIFRIVKNMKK